MRCLVLTSLLVLGGCRLDYKEAGSAVDAAIADSTPDATEVEVELAESIFFVDAADADNEGTAGACPGQTSWTDKVTGLEASLVGFPDPPCGNGGGWNGAGTPDDPFHLRFVPTQSVPFGTLGFASRYTVTAWVRWRGGASTPTGGGTFELIPIVARGTAETDSQPVDVNYWLGITPTLETLGSDFEELTSGSSHPIAGGTPLTKDTWYHLAVVYDQMRQRLYVNGEIDVSRLEIDIPSQSTASFLSIGADYLSDGTPAGGYFEGDVAVVRIFDRGLSSPEIRDECRAFASRFADVNCD